MSSLAAPPLDPHSLATAPATAAPAAKRPGYHHGDLRNALLAAARTLAGEVGAEQLTLREVARRAGVSTAAPYHHFSDKNALLRALAIDAFANLRLALADALGQDGDLLQKLQAIGCNYLQFAFLHQAEFQFMFSRKLCAPDGEIDPLQDAGLAAQQDLLAFVIRAQQAGQIRPGPPQILTLALWSSMHGLTTIVLDSPLGKQLLPESAQAMMKGVMEIQHYALKCSDS
jgi:AcrR family transcriptional regulator